MAGHEFMGMMRIVCSNIFPQDAVGNFCLDLYNVCQENNIPATLYATYFNSSMSDIIRQEKDVLTDMQPEDTLFFFCSIDDDLLDEIVKLPAKQKLVYFHGITKPHFFAESNPGLSAACLKGYQQLPLLKHFDKWAANSRATAHVLADHVAEINADDVVVIPPRRVTAATASRFREKTAEKTAHSRLLYVGRIKSHKKIDDLLMLFASFLKQDSTAELMLVGGQEDQAYMNHLHALTEKHLAESSAQIKWIGMANDDELKKAYRSATAYVSLSEDEGFCLPVFEAMLSGLPVFAYAIPAVKEVLGNSAGCFSHKNYDELAEWMHTMLNDSTSVAALIEKQNQRANELLTQMDGNTLLNFIRVC